MLASSLIHALREQINESKERLNILRLRNFFHEHSPEALQKLTQDFTLQHGLLSKERTGHFLEQKAAELGLTTAVVPKDSVNEYATPLIYTSYNLPYHLVSIVKTEGMDSTLQFNWDHFSFGTSLVDVENLESPCIYALHKFFEFFDETYSTVHPNALELRSIGLVIQGPFNNLKEEQDALQNEYDCLDTDINTMELNEYWQEHNPQKLLEHIQKFNRLYGYPFPGRLACPCESCQDRNGTFIEDLEINSDEESERVQTPCNLSCYLKNQLEYLGLTYEILSVDDLNYNGYTDDEAGPDFLGRCKFSPYLPKAFPQDCHFVFVNKMDWIIFGYGKRLWSAKYLWNAEIHKLNSFFNLTSIHTPPEFPSASYYFWGSLSDS